MQHREGLDSKILDFIFVTLRCWPRSSSLFNMADRSFDVGNWRHLKFTMRWLIYHCSARCVELIHIFGQLPQFNSVYNVVSLNQRSVRFVSMLLWYFPNNLIIKCPNSVPTLRFVSLNLHSSMLANAWYIRFVPPLSVSMQHSLSRSEVYI